MRQRQRQAFLKEGLIVSYPVDACIQHLERTFKDLYCVKVNHLFNIISYNNTSEKIQQINKVVFNLLGWFGANMIVIIPPKDHRIENENEAEFVYKTFDEDYNEKFNVTKLTTLVEKYPNLLVEIRMEPKYDYLVDYNELPKKLYHVTLKDKVEKILKQGLIPKSDNKLTSHPERIYFVINKLGAENLIIDHNFNKKDLVYSLLEIDLDDLKSHQKESDHNKKKIVPFKEMGVEFYKDPNFYLGYYTLNSIPPKFINVVEEEFKF